MYAFTVEINGGTEAWPVDAIYGKWTGSNWIGAIMRNEARDQMVLAYFELADDGV